MENLGLLTAWKAERNPERKTAYEWGRVIGLLKAHTHDDPARLTKAEIVGWKDALLASGKSAKTVSNHLLAASALFNWAVANERMRENPAKGVVVAGKGNGSTKRLPYTDEDAKVGAQAGHHRSEESAQSLLAPPLQGRVPQRRH
jgi:site-specific recombinase XerC